VLRSRTHAVDSLIKSNHILAAADTKSISEYSHQAAASHHSEKRTDYRLRHFAEVFEGNGLARYFYPFF